jgi:hypothetical protein
VNTLRISLWRLSRSLCVQPEVPATQAAQKLIKYPRLDLLGKSVDVLPTGELQYRIPTIFAPFYSGTAFSLEARNEQVNVSA